MAWIQKTKFLIDKIFSRIFSDQLAKFQTNIDFYGSNQKKVFKENWQVTFLIKQQGSCTKTCWILRRINKDAGFVYESLRIKTNWVIWDFCFHETNPRYKSLRFGFANPVLQIWNFRICKDSDLQISIFKDSFRAIVLRICKDSLDS